MNCSAVGIVTTGVSEGWMWMSGEARGGCKFLKTVLVIVDKGMEEELSLWCFDAVSEALKCLEAGKSCGWVYDDESLTVGFFL